MFDFRGFTVRFSFSGSIDVVPFAAKPTKPSGGSFSFIRDQGVAKAIFSGVNPPIPDEHVTARTVVINVAGVDSQPFDILDGSPAIVTGNEGDTVIATVTDTNSAGSTSGDPITDVIALPLSPPSKPTGGAFTFSA